MCRPTVEEVGDRVVGDPSHKALSPEQKRRTEANMKQQHDCESLFRKAVAARVSRPKETAEKKKTTSAAVFRFVQKAEGEEPKSTKGKGRIPKKLPAYRRRSSTVAKKET